MNQDYRKYLAGIKKRDIGIIGILIIAALLASVRAQDATRYPDAEAFRSLTTMEQQEVIDTITAENPHEAWQYLLSVATKNGTVVIDGHEAGHRIGNALFKRHGIESITECTTEFAYACLHGVTEELFVKEGPESIAGVEETCREYFLNGTGAIWNGFSGCIHGAGHGLLSYFVFDIPSALTACEGFSTDARTYCHDGVFMEAALGAPSVKEAIEKDPWLMCANVPTEAQDNCSRYLPVAVGAWALQKTPQKEGQTADMLVPLCLRAPEESMEVQCLETVGHMLAQHYHSAPEIILTRCMAITLEAQPICLDAAATELAFQQYENWKEGAQLLCAAIHDTNTSQKCLESATQTFEREQTE